MDWAVGGPGRDIGRPDAEELRVGDRVDSWRVLAVAREKRLALDFGMRAPGKGALEFVIERDEVDRTRLTATAYFQPAGMTGLLYWYSLFPAHVVIFDGMTREIARSAEAEPVQVERAA